MKVVVLYFYPLGVFETVSTIKNTPEKYTGRKYAALIEFNAVCLLKIIINVFLLRIIIK
jgi:hypothetical protein